jgi:hypothetical protein
MGPMRQALLWLQKVIDDPDAKARIVVLNGILSSYTIGKLDSLTLRTGSEACAAQVLEELVDDAEYERLSNDYFRLGIPSLVKQAANRIRVKVRRLLSRSRFTSVLDFTAKGVATAAHVPLPDSALVRALTPDGYLPPFVGIETPVRRAAPRARADDRSKASPRRRAQSTDWFVVGGIVPIVHRVGERKSEKRSHGRSRVRPTDG